MILPSCSGGPHRTALDTPPSNRVFSAAVGSEVKTTTTTLEVRCGAQLVMLHKTLLCLATCNLRGRPSLWCYPPGTAGAFPVACLVFLHPVIFCSLPMCGRAHMDSIPHLCPATISRGGPAAAASETVKASGISSLPAGTATWCSNFFALGS